MSKLEGKVAVITGGNSGIGLATAQQFVSDGAYVFITGRRQSELDSAVKQIDWSIVCHAEGPDILGAAPLGEISEEHFEKIFGINVKGILFTVQKALPLFQDGGSIILNASIAASKGIEASSVYSATKAAIRSFARTWTADLKQRKIRVNAISPGPIDTPIFNGVLNEEQTKQLNATLVANVPLGRMGNSDEVAKAASFLASDDSSYITGTELFVDGGTAQI
jgi:NAD(P)-dependent dehydrogenase (short-subunit alcohol dehydrogenase family)